MILHSPIPTEQYSSHTSVFFIWIFFHKVLDVDRSCLWNKESMAWWSMCLQEKMQLTNEANMIFFWHRLKKIAFFSTWRSQLFPEIWSEKKQRPLEQHNWQKNILSPAKSANLWYCVFVCLWMCRFHLKLKKFSWSLLCRNNSTVATRAVGIFLQQITGVGPLFLSCLGIHCNHAWPNFPAWNLGCKAHRAGLFFWCHSEVGTQAALFS